LALVGAGGTFDGSVLKRRVCLVRLLTHYLV
jgi:hypothetical protein